MEVGDSLNSFRFSSTFGTIKRQPLFFSFLSPSPVPRVSMPVTTMSHTKPLKPYRRGETLGTASRAGKPTGKVTAGRSRKVIPKVVEEVESEADVEEDEEEEESEEEEERMDIPAPLLKGRGKKGKTFVESQVSSLPLVASTRAHIEGIGRSHVARQLDNGVTGDEQEG